GSGVFAQVFDLDYGLSRADQDGNTLGQELQRIGYAGSEQPGQHPVGAYFEAHIEQGPILEAAGKTIGVVQGAQGQRWYEVTVTGQEAHAGPTPMLVRRDALVGAARMVEAVNRIGLEHQPNACATCGMLNVMPNSRNVIPGQVWFTVDFRHPDDAILAAMDQALRQELAQIAEAARLELALEQIWHSPATPFDESCVAAVRKGTEQAGYAHMDIISGAGHDAVYMAKIAPAAMIFVPCENGISHNEIENATPQDIAAGCNVLLHAMLEKANEKAHTSE
ncbi:MAG: Zn-dependent hydrolase, partial [Candidatus Competibacteraceae bacterium]|nr:Zn-dependent hydrolase [Candidatus Competibacteraceae bacterium]